MPDPIRKHFGYSQLWPLRPACSQNRAGSYNYARADIPRAFQFRFSKECAKLTWIRSGCPGQGLAKHIWSGSKPVCRNHLARFLAGRNRPATSFPTFRLGSVLPQTSRTTLCKTSPGSCLVLADCVWFWPNGSGTDPVRKQAGVLRIIRPGFWQDATGPLPVSPLSDSVPFFHRRPG